MFERARLTGANNAGFCAKFDVACPEAYHRNLRLGLPTSLHTRKRKGTARVRGSMRNHVKHGSGTVLVDRVSDSSNGSDMSWPREHRGPVPSLAHLRMQTPRYVKSSGNVCSHVHIADGFSQNAFPASTITRMYHRASSFRCPTSGCANGMKANKPRPVSSVRLSFQRTTLFSLRLSFPSSVNAGALQCSEEYAAR